MRAKSMSQFLATPRQSQRDCLIQPGVAKNELRRVSVKNKSSTLKRLNQNRCHNRLQRFWSKLNVMSGMGGMDATRFGVAGLSGDAENGMSPPALKEKPIREYRPFVFVKGGGENFPKFFS
jgi:hypothetical protein